MHADKNGQMIVCKMCNVVFGTLVELETHACASLDTPANVSSSGDLDQVTSVTPSRLSLSGGMKVGGGFPCDYCTMEFHSMENLKIHKEKNHKVNKLFVLLQHAPERLSF